MHFKKILFCLTLGVSIAQIINTSETEDIIFDLIDQPEALQNYLNINPGAIHAKDRNHQSILQKALIFGQYPRVIPILLNADADPNETCRVRGRSSINSWLHFLALQYNNPYHTQEIKDKIAQKAAWLILYGADDSTKNSDGQTVWELSPTMMHEINANENIKIRKQELKKEKLALAAFCAEQKQNAKLATELAELAGLTFSDE